MAIEVEGHLLIRLDEKKGAIHWDWVPIAVQEPKTSHWEKQISSEEFWKTLDRFFDAWGNCSQIMRGNKGRLFRIRFEKARDILQSLLTPPGMNLCDFPQGLITVTVSPDAIPIEVFDAGGEPFGVRCSLLHTKLSEGVNQKQDSSDTKQYKPSDERRRARAIFTADCGLTSPELKKHQDSIIQRLRVFYGHSCVDWRFDRPPIVEDLLESFSQPSMGCSYYFGHGVKGQTGGLKLADGEIDSHTIRSHLTRNRPHGAGLAFINACWSAALSNSSRDDVARVLLDNGWQAVIGAVLPPPAVQAAGFAERFFEAISENLNILKSFYSIRVSSWKKYRGENDEVPELNWAMYRLYGSPNQMCLPTLLTDGKSIVTMPGDRSFVLGRLSEDFSVQPQHFRHENLQPSAVLSWLQSISEMAEYDSLYLLKVASDSPLTQPIAHQIIAKSAEHPESLLSKKVFDPDLCLVIEDVKRLIKEQGLNSLDLEAFQQVVFCGKKPMLKAETIPIADMAPLFRVDERLGKLLLEVLRFKKQAEPIGLYEVIKAFEYKRPDLVKRLFSGSGGKLDWTKLERSARCILYDAWNVAMKKGDVISLLHLYQGITSFCMKLSLPTEEADLELKIKNIEAHFSIQGFELTEDQFAQNSLWVLGKCVHENVIPSSLQGGDWFWYRCLFHLFELLDTELSDHQHVLKQFVHSFKNVEKFLRFQTVPRIVRNIVVQPTRSPGVTPQAFSAFRHVLEALWNTAHQPQHVPVVKAEERLRVEAFLAHFLKQREGVSLLWLPWKDLWNRRETLFTLENFWRRIICPKSFLSNHIETLSEDLRKQENMLLCISDMDCLKDKAAWKAFQPFLEIIESPEISAVMVISDNLLYQRSRFLESPYHLIEPAPLSDEAIKEMLKYHVEHWLKDKGLEKQKITRNDKILEKLLNLARTPDVCDLFSRTGEITWQAIVRLPNKPNPETVWHQIYEEAQSVVKEKFY